MKLAEGVGPRKHDVQAVIISSQDSVGRAMDILAQEMVYTASHTFIPLLITMSTGELRNGGEEMLGWGLGQSPLLMFSLKRFLRMLEK